MKILVIVPRPEVRGPIREIASLLNTGLQGLGCEVNTAEWGRRREKESLFAKVIERPLDVVQVLRALRRKYDVMLIHTAHDWFSLIRDLPLLMTSRAFCPCIVLLLHGSASEQLVGPGQNSFRLASALLQHLSSAILLLSTEEQDQWHRFRPRGQYHVVKNPFVPRKPGLAILPNSPLALPEDRPILLFVGRVMAYKGVFELVQAMPSILDHKPAHLVVAGDGPAAMELEQRIKELHLAGHVTLTGHVDRDLLHDLYSRAHVLILPTSHREGFPTVISEAMGAGLPIVTTRIRGVADHLVEGVHAVFVPQRDPVALAGAVTRLLQDSSLRQRMSAANREKVLDFAPSIVARDYLRILNELVVKSDS